MIKEQQRLKTITEAIEYDPSHPEKMHPSIEKELRQDTHHFKQSSSFPGTGSEQKYSEKVASKRFKDIITTITCFYFFFSCLMYCCALKLLNLSLFLI